MRSQSESYKNEIPSTRTNTPPDKKLSYLFGEDLATNLARSIDLKGWGSDFTRIMDAYEYIAGMWLVGEDMPQKTNCVTLHPTEKDQFGIPIPNVHFDDHANDIAMRNHAYKPGAMV
jgi:hypothetical protein